MSREIKFREWETERKTLVIGKWEDYDGCIKFTDKSKAEAVTTLV